MAFLSAFNLVVAGPINVIARDVVAREPRSFPVIEPFTVVKREPEPEPEPQRGGMLYAVPPKEKRAPEPEPEPQRGGMLYAVPPKDKRAPEPEREPQRGGMLYAVPP